jgi:hypothetical protein
VQSELTAHGHRALAVQRIKSKCLGYWRARRGGEREATDLSDAVRAVMARNWTARKPMWSRRVSEPPRHAAMS